uniref:Uncharacterized protein n=1 Tax=Anguilla anguilla TaxID=7936 RepID=A0A0E9Q185_ANGAN
MMQCFCLFVFSFLNVDIQSVQLQNNSSSLSLLIVGIKYCSPKHPMESLLTIMPYL